MANAGGALTSNSQGFKSESIITSNPNNSNELEVSGIELMKFKSVSTIIYFI